MLKRSSRTTIRWNAAATAWLVLLLLAGAADAALGAGTAAGVLIVYVTALPIGWILGATVLSRIFGGGLAAGTSGWPEDLHALGGFRLRVRLVNPHRRRPALFLTVDFSLGWRGEPLVAPPRFIGVLGPRQEVVLEWDVVVRGRGAYSAGGLRVRAAFPGSLVAVETCFDEDRELVALPAVYEIDRRAFQLLAGRRQAAGRLHAHPAAMEEFTGVRDYRPGDNPRLVHLALSLRMPEPELVIREYEDPSEDDVCILLDTTVPYDAQDLALLLYRHEKSISFALGLCRLFATRRYRVRFQTVDHHGAPLEYDLRTPGRTLRDLERALVGIVPAPDRRAVWRLVDAASRRTNSAVFFVSLRDTPEERLNPRLSVLTLTPRHVVSLTRRVVGA